MNHKKKVVRKSRIRVPTITVSPTTEKRRNDTKELLDYLKRKRRKRIRKLIITVIFK